MVWRSHLFLSAVWLQLQRLWIAHNSISPAGVCRRFRLRSVTPACSCNAAVLRAEEWQVWWCVTEVQGVRGGDGKEGGRGGRVRWMKGEERTCWDHWHHRTRWKTGQLEKYSWSRTGFRWNQHWFGPVWVSSSVWTILPMQSRKVIKTWQSGSGLERPLFFCCCRKLSSTSGQSFVLD